MGEVHVSLEQLLGEVCWLGEVRVLHWGSSPLGRSLGSYVALHSSLGRSSSGPLLNSSWGSPLRGSVLLRLLHVCVVLLVLRVLSFLGAFFTNKIPTKLDITHARFEDLIDLNARWKRWGLNLLICSKLRVSLLTSMVISSAAMSMKPLGQKYSLNHRWAEWDTYPRYRAVQLIL